MLDLSNAGKTEIKLPMDLSWSGKSDLPRKAQIINQWYLEHASEYIFNQELNVYTNPDTGHCIRWMMERDKDWNKYYRQWREIRWHNNGKWYMVFNIWLHSKYKAITHHRTIFCTLNKLPYGWDYTVGHFDEDPTNNLPSNLYWIYGSNQQKWNIEQKKVAYKLLELYTQWLLFDSEWKKICL